MVLLTFCSNTKFQVPKSIPDYWDPAALPDLGFKVWDSHTLELDRRGSVKMDGSWHWRVGMYVGFLFCFCRSWDFHMGDYGLYVWVDWSS